MRNGQIWYKPGCGRRVLVREKYTDRCITGGARCCECVKANRNTDTRLRLQTKLCGETMMRRPSTAVRDRLFKVHNRHGSLSATARKSDYKNRFILTGARDPTKTRAGP